VFAPNWRARAELRYADLGKSTVDCVPGVGFCSVGEHSEFRNSLTMGLVGVAYQFGGSNAANWSTAMASLPAARAVSNWTGAYIGIQGGAARHDASFDDGSFFQSGGNNIRFYEGKTGGTAGGLLGYNWQKGSFVYGLEGDWNWIGAKINRTKPVFDTGSASTSYDIGWVATLRGRGGLAFDATLLYFTAGAAWAQVKDSVDFINDPLGDNQSIAFTQKKIKIGWTAGVGVEHMFSPHWTARAEVRYVDLGNSKVDCRVVTSDINGCGSIGYRGEFSNALVQGLVGLAYKF
jgi:outer membrane immunogenic protein